VKKLSATSHLQPEGSGRLALRMLATKRKSVMEPEDSGIDHSPTEGYERWMKK